jgi:GNAT superfamily N-acetyltransferase
LIRNATHSDVATLIRLGGELHQESSFASTRWNPEKAERAVRNLIDNEQFCIVYERDGKIAGFMGGYATQPWYSDDLIAADLSLYITPGFRGSGMAAVRMIKAFTDWAKDAGVTQIRPGVSTGVIGSAAERLYQSLGYSRSGCLFVMEVGHGLQQKAA